MNLQDIAFPVSCSPHFNASTKGSPITWVLQVNFKSNSKRKHMANSKSHWNCTTAVWPPTFPHTILPKAKLQTLSLSAYWMSQKFLPVSAPFLWCQKPNKKRSCNIAAHDPMVNDSTSCPSFILPSAECRYKLEQLPDHDSLPSQQASVLMIYCAPIVIYGENFFPLQL